MRKTHWSLILLLFLIGWQQNLLAQADRETYLSGIKTELQKQWPHNRTINLVFHGHSVPSGYARTPLVKTFDSYPFLLLKELKARYPDAVINVIITAIGGENSAQGEKRFKKQVLTHRPDVLFIDYALNDRYIGLEKSKKAMEKMIRMALRRRIKVILLTPSPDLTVNILQPDNALEKFSGQIIALAAKYKIGLADSYGAFKKLAASGQKLEPYMAQSNHPDRAGNQVIADEIVKWFGGG